MKERMKVHSDSQQKVKKPWEKELMDISLILISLVFLSVQPLIRAQPQCRLNDDLGTGGRVAKRK